MACFFIVSVFRAYHQSKQKLSATHNLYTYPYANLYSRFIGLLFNLLTL